MKSANWARLGLTAFAAVFACSSVALIAGNLRPTYAQPLEVGDRVGTMVLRDQEGTAHELLPSARRVMLLVCTPDAGLSAQQAARIADFENVLRERTAVETVAVVAATDPDHLNSAGSVCELVVQDPRHSLWALRSSTAANATICLIDAYGFLRFRGELAPEETIAAVASERPLLKTALAAMHGR